jgi:hypothetical protein
MRDMLHAKGGLDKEHIEKIVDHAAAIDGRAPPGVPAGTPPVTPAGAPENTNIVRPPEWRAARADVQAHVENLARVAENRDDEPLADTIRKIGAVKEASKKAAIRDAHLASVDPASPEGKRAARMLDDEVLMRGTGPAPEAPPEAPPTVHPLPSAPQEPTPEPPAGPPPAPVTEQPPPTAAPPAEPAVVTKAKRAAKAAPDLTPVTPVDRTGPAPIVGRLNKPATPEQLQAARESSPPGSGSLEQRIARVYQGVSDGGKFGDPARIADIHAALPDVPLADLHKAMNGMDLAQTARLHGFDYGADAKQRDIDSQLMLGGRGIHRIILDGPLPEPPAPTPAPEPVAEQPAVVKAAKVRAKAKPAAPMPTDDPPVKAPAPPPGGSRHAMFDPATIEQRITNSVRAHRQPGGSAFIDDIRADLKDVPRDTQEKVMFDMTCRGDLFPYGADDPRDVLGNPGPSIRVGGRKSDPANAWHVGGDRKHFLALRY